MERVFGSSRLRQTPRLAWVVLAASVGIPSAGQNFLSKVAHEFEANAPRPQLDFPLPPDTRPSACRRSFEGVDLGQNVTVSIIIPYLRESWDHFRPTMRSILHFTPDALIQELLLVSDANPPELAFGDDLAAMSPKVRVIQNEKRLGLIKSKMRAVEEATGTVLVFMEAHCIVNRQWLEPLLARVREAPHALVQPALDVIPQTDFNQYLEGIRGHFRFEWNMNLIFTTPPEPTELGLRDDDPVPSPATSGGIFAIRRDWWNKLGFYDPEMLEWGGDHVEATMKVWRCGGHIDVHPCSRVGHLFRDPAHRPYDVNIDVVVRNYARLARVWFDDHLPNFYRVKPETKRMDVGDLAPQQRLREELGCKDMSWYLAHVDPEMEWEAERICIPGALSFFGGCDGPAAPGHSTVDETMPAELYKKRRAEIVAHAFDEESMESHEL